MKLQDIIDEIRLEVFAGGILDSELKDSDIIAVVNKELRELERFWDETTFVTVPFATCIDLSGFDYCSIVKVYRTSGYGGTSDDVNAMTDPVYAQQWMVFSNLGTMYNLSDYILNYASWCTMSQIRNTMSSDMAMEPVVHDNKLYINSISNSGTVTIEYIPKITSVEDIKSSYWIDVLIKLSTAMVKVVVGRIRTKYKQSNALWELDGETLLQEGKEELDKLREKLEANDAICAPID